MTNVRRGHAPPDDLVAELRRRYEAIGGASPLTDITAEADAAAGGSAPVPVAVGNAQLGAVHQGRDRGARRERRPARRPHPDRAAVSTLSVRRGPRLGGGAPARRQSSPPPTGARRADLCPTFAARVLRPLEPAAGGHGAGDDGAQPASGSISTPAISTGRSRRHGAVAAAVAEQAAARQQVRRRLSESGLTDAGGRVQIPWLGPTLDWAIDDSGDRAIAKSSWRPNRLVSRPHEILFDLDIEARRPRAIRTTCGGQSLTPRGCSLNCRRDFVEVLTLAWAGK